MRDAYISQDGWAYLLDKKEDETILRVPAADGTFELVPEEILGNGRAVQEVTLNGRKAEVIRIDSDYLGLTYVSVLPKDYITVQINKDQQKLFLLIVAVLFVGIGSILLVSWKRGKRIDGILQMLFSLGAEAEEEPVSYTHLEIISTYVFKRGMKDLQYSFATAVGLFNSVVNFILLFTANKLSQKFGETSLW